MNRIAIDTTAKIIIDTAVTFLANKHGVTEQQVIAEYRANPTGNLAQQIAQIIAIGVEEAATNNLVRRACA